MAESGGRQTGQQRTELRDFLRSRRARISPEAAGMPVGGRRRTPGLRREEVAVLAGMGVSWYTWLEQGRDITVSSSVLDAVARVLQLDETERVHLYRLCGMNPPHPLSSRPALELARLRRVVDGWLPNPAYVIDSCGNVLATNQCATAVFGVTDENYNCPLTFFSDERVQECYPERDKIARRLVAQLRATAGARLGDPEFDALVSQLHRVSRKFGQLWSRHEIGGEHSGVLLFRHPRFGPMTFEQTALKLAEDADLRLMVYLALPEDGGSRPRYGTDRPGTSPHAA